MGLLTLFKKPPAMLLRLPSGAFTMDPNGTVLVRTVPSEFPQQLVEEIGRMVLDAFREANAAQVPLSQITITYPNFKIAARELRGGALIFLSPQNPLGTDSNK